MQKASRHPRSRKGIMASRNGAASPLAASRGDVSTRVVAARSPSPRPSPLGRGGRKGFTLTELMIAVLILIVIILATSRIFSAASRVTAMGGATADVLQEVASIERQLRQDFANLAQDGFFAVRCVAVRNDANQNPLIGAATAPLINPLLPPEAWVRADQLVFFTNSKISSQGFADSDSFPYAAAGAGEDTANLDAYAQSAVSRVYYGHGIQLPALSAKTQADPGKIQYDAYDTLDANPAPGVYPWTFDPAPTGTLAIYTTDPVDGNTANNNEYISATQPNSLQWVLARQQVLLADDGKSTDFFFQRDPPDGSNPAPFRNSTFSIFDTGPDLDDGAMRIRNGRVDVCSQQMNDVRTALFDAMTSGSPGWDWDWARSVIIGPAMSYPRAERVAPTMFRRDQILTSSVIGSACSSFRIEWTYDDGVATHVSGNGDVFIGNIVPPGEQPWFGLDERFPEAVGATAPGAFPVNRWGVSTFSQYVNYVNQQFTSGAIPGGVPGTWLLLHTFGASDVPDPDFVNLERMPDGINTVVATWDLPLLPTDPSAPVRVYEAFFGPNQSVPFGRLVSRDIDGVGGTEPPQLVPLSNPDLTILNPDGVPIDLFDHRYTPWPSAIRITMTLHDTEGKLSSGREVQFIVRLPQRGGAS